MNYQPDFVVLLLISNIFAYFYSIHLFLTYNKNYESDFEIAMAYIEANLLEFVEGDEFEMILEQELKRCYKLNLALR
jgi:hypothetical protein